MPQMLPGSSSATPTSQCLGPRGTQLATRPFTACALGISFNLTGNPGSKGLDSRIPQPLMFTITVWQDSENDGPSSVVTRTGICARMRVLSRGLSYEVASFPI